MLKSLLNNTYLLLAMLHILLIIKGCQPKDTNAETLAKAAVIHNEMMEIANVLDNELNLFSSSQHHNQDSLKILKQHVELWQSNLIEVPGNEGDEHTHQGHVHNHEQNPVALTPTQIFEIQVEMKSELMDLKKRFENLKNQK